MKRIYDYHTGKLIKESANTLGKNRLYEGASFDVDIIENAKSVYRVQSNYNSRVLYLKKLVLSPSEKPIAIWEFTGNFCAREIEKICDAAGLDYCSVSAKSLRGSIKDIYNNEKFIIVDDFTYGQTGAVEDLIFDLIDLSKVAQVVCVGKISNRNNDIFVEDLCAEFNNFVYSTADDTDDNVAYESVSDKFAKYRKLYEAEDSEDDSSDEAGDGEGTENSDEEGKDEPKDGDGNSEDDDTEDVPMTAIVLTVKKDDVDKCKEELVDAGIPEDAITEVDTEEDDENGKLKVDADYALELKDYLKGKGIDLEEKIGGEIIDDSTEDSDDDGDKEKKKDDEEGSEEGGDFDAEFGDLFGEE